MDDLFDNVKKSSGEENSPPVALSAQFPEEVPLLNEEAVADQAAGGGKPAAEEEPEPPFDFSPPPDKPAAPEFTPEPETAPPEPDAPDLRLGGADGLSLNGQLQEEYPVLNEEEMIAGIEPAEHQDSSPVVPGSNTPEPIAVKPLPEHKLKRPSKLNFEAYGDTMRRLRESNGLSLDDLAGRTLINQRYLVALEREDYKNLPPPVYIAAYVRKLGNLYGLSENEILTLTEKVRAMMEYDLPEEMSKVVLSYEQSEENDEKLRRILLFAGLGALILIAAIVTAAMLMTSPRKTADPVEGRAAASALTTGTSGTRFDEGELIRRREPIMLAPGSLPDRRR